MLQCKGSTTPSATEGSLDQGGVAEPVMYRSTWSVQDTLNSCEHEAERYEEAEEETSSEPLPWALRQSTCSRYYTTWDKWQLA